MDSGKNGKSEGIYVIPSDSQTKKIPVTTKRFWNIDKEMLKFKLHYFLYIGGQGAGLPYVVVFAKDRVGISASSLGAILTVQMFIFIFSKILIGYIADYFNKLKAIICTLTILHVVCFFLLLATPSLDKLQMKDSSAYLNHTPLYNTSDFALEYILNINTSSSNGLEMVTQISNRSIIEKELEHKVCSECLLGENVTHGTLKNCLQTLSEYSIYVYNQTTNFILDEQTCNLKIIVTDDKQKWIIFQDREQFSNLILQSYNESSSSDLTLDDISLFLDEVCASQRDAYNLSSEKAQPVFNSLCLVHQPGSSQVDGKKTLNETRTLQKDPFSIPVPEESKISDFATYKFWAFAFIYTISQISTNAIFTLSDTALCESAERCGAEFGKQRLWGGIGWGLIAPTAGVINDYTQDYLGAWIIMAVMMVLFLWNIMRLDLAKPQFSKNILKDVRTVLRSREFIIYEIVIFINGAGSGMIWFYLLWFLTSIGGSKLLCGLSLAVQSYLGVIPFMFFSGWIIRKVGHFRILIIAMAGFAIRFLWYSYLQNPWLVLPAEFLHGITYGLYYTTLASYAKMSSKPGTEATTQAIVFSTNEGLGGGIGCVLAGISFDYFGGRQTYFIASMVSVSGVVLSILLSFVVGNRQNILQVTPAVHKNAH